MQSGSLAVAGYREIGLSVVRFHNADRTLTAFADVHEFEDNEEQAATPKQRAR